MKKIRISGYLKYVGGVVPQGYTILLGLYTKEKITLADDFTISGFKSKMSLYEIYNKAFKSLNKKVSGYSVKYLIEDEEFTTKHFEENFKETYWEEITLDYEIDGGIREILILGDLELETISQMNQYIDKYIHFEITTED